jgi:hypothetical protein
VKVMGREMRGEELEAAVAAERERLRRLYPVRNPCSFADDFDDDDISTKPHLPLDCQKMMLEIMMETRKTDDIDFVRREFQKSFSYYPDV